MEKSEENFVVFDSAIYYSMEEVEAKAYRILTIWLERSRKMFPEYTHTRMRKGDPRKSTLFKWCYKLARETKGILDEEEYDVYVRAQLEILRVISKHSAHPNIDIQCLVGEKAWKRWKLWKAKYDTKTKIIEGKLPTAPQTKVCFCLESTKKWFVGSIGADPTYEKFRETITNKNLFRWIIFGKVSPYYLVLSPYIAKAFPEGIKEAVDLDLEVYRSSITQGVTDRFRELFPNEFSS